MPIRAPSLLPSDRSTAIPVRDAAPMRSALRTLGLMLAGSWLLAISAQCSISMMPFSPVPVTGQSLAVLLLGVLLGPRLSGAAVLTYLAQGAAGLPVFAGGAAGPNHLIGPTAGYLWAFLPAAMLVGILHEAGFTRRWLGAIATFTLGTAVIFLAGIAWLGLIGASLGVDTLAGVLGIGLYPYLPGAALKIALAMAFLPRPARPSCPPAKEQ